MMGDLEYAITFDVVNDTGSDYPITVLSAWVNDHPIALKPIVVEPDITFSLRFSDVLIDRAIATGQASALVRPSLLAEQQSE